MGGTPSWWRLLKDDARTDAAWKPVYQSMDAIQPWAVGRFGDSAGAENWKRTSIVPDLAETKANGNFGYDLNLVPPSQQLLFGGNFTTATVNLPNGNTRAVFVYEVASATVLLSRTVGNPSSVNALSNDGTKFMAGATLFDTATLQVLARQNSANAPYPFTAAANFKSPTKRIISV